MFVYIQSNKLQHNDQIKHKLENTRDKLWVDRHIFHDVITKICGITYKLYLMCLTDMYSGISNAKFFQLIAND